MRRTTHSALSLLVTLAALAPIACDGEVEPTPTPTPSHEATIADRLSWTRATAATTQELTTLLGVVELATDATHQLAPPLPARIVRWHIQQGQPIALGATLAELEIPSLRGLQSAQRAAAALVSARQAQAASLQVELEAGVRDAASLRDAALSLSEAEASLGQLNAQLRAAQPAALLTPLRGGRWRWHSAVEGVVAQLRCAPGASVEPQDQCLTLIEARRSAVRVDVPEQTLPALDRLTRATWQPSGEEAVEVEVEVMRRAPGLDLSSHTLALYLTSADPETRWTPGRTGQVVLHIPVAPGTVVVPRSAVIELEGSPHVFVRDARDSARPLQVSRTGELDGEVIVRGEGLEVGSEVVSRGTFLLKSIALLKQED